MYFEKNDVIELKGGKKHIVVDVLKHDGIYYYYLCEINQEETNVNPVFKVITTVTENGNLFIKTVKDELAVEIESKFKKELNIE